jgi:hypothetical protein
MAAGCYCFDKYTRGWTKHICTINVYRGTDGVMQSKALYCCLYCSHNNNISRCCIGVWTPDVRMFTWVCMLYKQVYRLWGIIGKRTNISESNNNRAAAMKIADVCLVVRGMVASAQAGSKYHWMLFSLICSSCFLFINTSSRVECVAQW